MEFHIYVSARYKDVGNIDTGAGGKVDHENLSSQEWTLVIHTNFIFSGRKASTIAYQGQNSNQSLHISWLPGICLTHGEHSINSILIHLSQGCMLPFKRGTGKKRVTGSVNFYFLQINNSKHSSALSFSYNKGTTFSNTGVLGKHR